MKIDRHMAMLSYIIDKKEVTASELSDLFSVSVRTIWRDIDDLTLAGIPLYTTRGSGGGIRLLDTYRSEKYPLTTSELSAIELGLRTRHQVLGDASSLNAMMKLQQTSTQNIVDIDMNLSYGNIELRTRVDLILDAINRSSIILFQYINESGNVSNKKCEPYRIIFKESSWYVEAFDIEKERYSVYKLARMSDIVIGELFIPRVIEPIDYSDTSWIDAERVELELEVSQTVIDHFIELLGSKDIVKSESGIFRVKYKVKQNEYGFKTLLKFGSSIKILSPQAFIDDYKKYIQSILDDYNEI